MLKSIIGACFIALSVVTISACAPDLVAGTGGAGTGGMDASSSANSTGVGGASSSSSSSSSSGSSGGELGSPCGTSNDCVSPFVCEDGVCCDGPCATCKSCNQAGSMGKCSGLSLGADDCSENGELCDKTGVCACGVSVPPQANVGCPAGWDSPMGGECRLNADLQDEYKIQGTITCPPNADCFIDCSGSGACEGTTFVCPPGHRCTMNCTNTDSCKNAILNCSDDGPCNVECASGGMSCRVTVNCGFNSCTATCLDFSKPMLLAKAGSVCPFSPCP